MSSVSLHQQELGKFLLKCLDEYVERRRLGKVLYADFAMRIEPGRPPRCPDILFVANESMDRLKSDHLEGPCDLAIEIVSPQSAARDRVEKFAEYERSGVREFWLIEPNSSRADFYVLGYDNRYHPLHAKDGLVRSQAVGGLWLRLNWLWQEPLPRLDEILEQWRLR